MQQVNVKFNNVKQIEQFVNIIEQFEAHFDLESGQKVVNAKSILGVFALDLSEPLSLCYSSKDAVLIEKIEPFLYRHE
ncbi:MAG: HPr family phosphocarrier protein [Eubacterium sp.]|nr:HPr family phosphocarrier protein [Eubacterium sp.]